jgi:flagellar motility protein MotE (MotC chaperone)
MMRFPMIAGLGLTLTLLSAHAAIAEEFRDAPASDASQFCANVTDDARERRYALKEQELEGLVTQIDARMKALETKRAELEDWQNRREEFSKLATDNLVQIYAKMRPASAAERMEILPIDLSASILAKLSSRQAGVILNEMKTEQAAVITSVMAASSRKKDPS